MFAYYTYTICCIYLYIHIYIVCTSMYEYICIMVSFVLNREGVSALYIVCNMHHGKNVAFEQGVFKKRKKKSKILYYGGMVIIIKIIKIIM